MRHPFPRQRPQGPGRLASMLALALVGLSVPASAQVAPEGAALEAEPAGPTVEVGARGLGVTSADGAYAVQLRGWAQLSGRFFVGDDDEVGTNELLVRRIRPIFVFTAHDELSLRIMPDIASGLALFDVYVDWTPSPPANLRIGTNGGRNPSDDFDLAARVFVRPFARSPLPAIAGLGVGGGVTWGEETGTLTDPVLPRYVTAGRRAFFRYGSGDTAEATAVADGTRLRTTGQLYYHAGGFELLGELVVVWHEVTLGIESAELRHAAWHAGIAYALGGEADSSGVRPERSVFDGGLGALQAKLRYGQLDIDEAAFPTFVRPGSAERATELSGGLNWWLSRNARLMLDYVHTAFDAPEGGQAPPDEDAVTATVQLAL